MHTENVIRILERHMAALKECTKHTGCYGCNDDAVEDMDRLIRNLQLGNDFEVQCQARGLTGTPR